MIDILLEKFIRLLRGTCFLFIGTFLLFACNSDKSNSNQSVPLEEDLGTKEMVAELKAIANNRSNIQIWHLNKERALAMDARIPSIQDPGTKLSMSFKAAAEWLNAGEYNTAIERLKALLQLIETNKYVLPNGVLATMQELLGVAYLRKAEVENCLKNHNAYSCLIPIEPPGQHSAKTPAENAAKIFEGILQKDPSNTQVKWLYNIAQMTLGGYPQAIDSKFMIPPKVFDGDNSIRRFQDKAMELGLAINDISGSVVMDDFNNDHLPDLMISSYGLDDQLHYFENNGKGGFDDKTQSSNIEGLFSGLNMVQADYDNDGWLDVLVLRGAWLGKEGKHPNSLLKNNGDGTFSDVSKSAGIYSKFPTQTASWADFNNDGYLDLFIANEHSKSMSAPCQLFQNNGDGTFKEVASEKGIAVKAFIKGCVWGDYNNDGFPDLYLSLQNGDNYLMKNGGPSKSFSFSNASAAAGTLEPKRSFPCWFFDYNQDGWEDIFVSGFDTKKFETAAGEVARDYLGEKISSELPRLYQNNKDGTFTEVSAQTGVNNVLFTMGCNFGDLNNDGYPDFYAATGTPDFRAQIPNRMYLNKAGKSFSDVSKAGGFGHLQKGHGVAFGDIDMDGDQDIYHVLGGSYDGDNFMNALFTNPGHEKNWVNLKFVGTKSNRSAIGTRVTVTAENSLGMKRKFYSRVNSGASFGANPLTVEQKVTGVESGKFWKITENASVATEISISAIELKGNHKHDHH